MKACQALEVSRATVYRRRSRGKIEEHTKKARQAPTHALSSEERQAVLEVLNSERFMDMAPREVYATLLDEGIYLCSISTFYRILAGEQQVRERRKQRSHRHYQKPELLATDPNQVWSWDITKLKGPTKWNYFYLYVIIDIYSRYVVGWTVSDRESASLARQLIQETCEKQEIVEDQLTIHSDRGASMKSKTVAQLLGELGVTKSFSRPYVSNDNPFSESHFKTLKYRPEFPDRFGCPTDSIIFCREFFTWYNQQHHHTALGLLTPEAVHYGRATQIIEDRRNVLQAAYEKNPGRFRNKVPCPPPLPEAVWINPPEVVKQSQGGK